MRRPKADKKKPAAAQTSPFSPAPGMATSSLARRAGSSKKK